MLPQATLQPTIPPSLLLGVPPPQQPTLDLNISPSAASNGHGWTQHTSKDGRTFWHNSKTNKSTWDKPDCLKSELELIMSFQTPWKEYATVDGRNYWYNKETKLSVWDCPEEIKQLKQELSREWVPFSEKSLATERLKTLFKLKNLGPRSRWEDALNTIKTDSRFNCFSILTSGEKKQAFAEYQNQIQKQQRDRDRTRKVEARKIFLEELTKWPSLTPASLLSEFESSFKDEWWHMCLSAAEKDDLFNEYIEEWEPAYWEEHRANRKKQRLAISDFLRSSAKISIDMTWKEAAEVFLEQEELKGAEPNDYLGCWEEFVLKADYAEREMQKLKMQRMKRKRRDAFRALIRKRINDGSINARVPFSDFIEIHQDHLEYLDLVGVAIATPREIFDEETELLIESYENQKHILKIILRSFDIRVTSTTTYDGFMRALETSEDSKEISETNARLFYDSLKRRAVRREREKRGTDESVDGDRREDSGEDKKREGSESRQRVSKSNGRDSAEGLSRHLKDSSSTKTDQWSSKDRSVRDARSSHHRGVEMVDVEVVRSKRSRRIEDRDRSHSLNSRNPHYRERSKSLSETNEREKKRTRRCRSSSRS